MNRKATSLGAVALLAGGLASCSDGAPFPDIDPPGLGSFKPPGLSPLVRPDTPGNNLLFKFQPDDVVEKFPTTAEGNFVVHFTRNGKNSVPATDTDGSGVPDFVEEVASVYEQVLSHYKGELGFRAPLGDKDLPDNGGDGRFDVYLVDFGKAADGNYSNDTCSPTNPEACAGYMIQENDFAGYGYPSTLIANRILASHEFFHAIQASYDIGQGRIFDEGTAVWGTETFDPTLKDFEGFIHGYLDSPDHSLNVPIVGPVDSFSYGSAIFFQFLEERYGKGTIRQLWERCENGENGVTDPDWFTELGPLLKARANVTFEDAFIEFATYNLLTGPFADPSKGYKNGAGYPAVKIESITAPHQEEKLRLFYASTHYYGAAPSGRKAMTAALVSADPAATAGLTALLAVQRGTTYEPIVKLSDLGAGTQTVDTTGADRLVVAVINGLTQGDSRRPGLCVGDADEVAACRAALLQQGGQSSSSSSSSAASSGSGAGSSGSSSSGAGGSEPSGSGAGGGTVSPDPPEDNASGCGCREAPSTPLPKGLPLLAVALGALTASRSARRRRQQKEALDSCS